METENLESILSQIVENKLTEEDQMKIKEILGKYGIKKNVEVNNNDVEQGFESFNEEWQDPTELDYLHEHETTSVPVSEVSVPIEKPILEIDENGQYQLPFITTPQMQLDLISPEEVSPKIETTIPVIEDVTPVIDSNEPILGKIATVVDTLPENKVNSRIEPIFTLDAIPEAVAQSTTLNTQDILQSPPVKTKFKSFENMAQNTLGKVHNLFNFKDQNGKIDWHNKATKTVLLLKNIKNSALDNKLVNRVKSLVNEKYSKSKLGIKTNKIADTITINLMSREERYNKDFKNTIALLGYEVKELIAPNSTPMLTLQDVSNNVNKTLKEKLDLDLTDNGYSSKFLSTLSEENQVRFIQKMVWPKLTEMIGESIKLFEALKEIKSKNPLCKEISQMAMKNNIEEELFITMLLKNPEALKQKGVEGIEKLLEQKIEIENVYFKNEELSGKNFIVIQNLIKASSSMQTLVANSHLPKEQKQQVLLEMKNTVVKSDSKKKVLFETVQDSVTSSLKDNDFVKSLREVNESILKIRNTQNKETNLKPKI